MDLTPLIDELRSRKEISLKLKVVPKSSKNDIVGFMTDGSLKVKVAASPENGKANAELCFFLAQQFGVPQRNVSLLSGETSPHKVVRITGWA